MAARRSRSLIASPSPRCGTGITAMVRAALASVANTAVAPLQDLLGLGTAARMNLPNSISGNWAWRFSSGSLTEDLSRKLRDLSELYGRLNGVDDAI